jgi:hypothetical protein
MLASVSRLESDDAFASLDRRDLPELAIGACRLAIDASGVEDEVALAALREVEEGSHSAEAPASMPPRLGQRAGMSPDGEGRKPL